MCQWFVGVTRSFPFWTYASPVFLHKRFILGHLKDPSGTWTTSEVTLAASAATAGRFSDPQVTSGRPKSGPSGPGDPPKGRGVQQGQAG